MRVWIVRGYCSYEGFEIMGVYLSEASANAEKARQEESDDRYKPDWFDVVEHEAKP